MSRPVRAYGRSLGYGQLLVGVRRLEVLAAEPPLTRPAAWHFAGHPGHAASWLDAVTGDRRFVSACRVIRLQPRMELISPAAAWLQCPWP